MSASGGPGLLITAPWRPGPEPMVPNWPASRPPAPELPLPNGKPWHGVSLLQATLVKAVQDVRDGRVDMSIGETVSAATPALRGLPGASAGYYVLDEENPAGIADTLYRALPRGSYAFIHHLLDMEDPAAGTLQDQMRAGWGRAQFRTRAQIMSLFAGLELVEPGLVLVPDWRPDPGTPGVRDHPVLQVAAVGVARKP